MLQRVVVGAQHVQLLLGKVANHQAFAGGEGARQHGQHARNGFDQRGLALAVGPQYAQALARHDRAGDVLHDCRGLARGQGVAHRGVAQGQHGVGQLGGFVKGKAELGIGQHGGNALHALQRLDAALRLLGFRGLGFEAVNKALQLGHLVLLARKGSLLLAHLLGAHGLEAAVVAAVAREASIVDVQRDLRDAI